LADVPSDPRQFNEQSHKIPNFSYNQKKYQSIGKS
jgi:hypothetical protein